MALASSSFRRFAKDVSAQVAALLVVAALTGTVGYLWGAWRAEAHAQYIIQVAALRYADELKSVIDRAARAADDKDGLAGKREQLLIYARSIVSIRDDLRGTLLALSSQLNSDLDKLSSLLSQYEKEKTEPLAQEIAVTIGVLHETWPSKQLKIDDAIEKLLVELHLQRIDFPQRR